MLDAVHNNLMYKQNPFEVVFKYISIFDAQTSIPCSLLSEIKSGKITDNSVEKFLNKASNQKKSN